MVSKQLLETDRYGAGVENAGVRANAPRRIWATVNGASTQLPGGGRMLVGGWSEDPSRQRSREYVRRDVVDVLSSALKNLIDSIEIHDDPALTRAMDALASLPTPEPSHD